MIKNKIGLLIGIMIFILGLVLKYLLIIGAGTLMAIGLIVIIIISSINFAHFENKKITEFLIYFIVIFVSTRIFSLIQHRLFFEIFAAGLTIGLVSYMITYIAGKIKKRHDTK